MSITFTINLAYSARTWHNTGGTEAAIGAGQWRIMRRVYNAFGGSTLQVMARTQNPNGWSVSVDNGDTPTQATITSPLEIGEFDLRFSYIQNGTVYNPETGYGNDPLSPPVGYVIEIFSTTTEMVPIGSDGMTLPGGRLYSKQWDVISYGPKAEPFEAGMDLYDSEGSYIGRREIKDGNTVLMDSIGIPLVYVWQLWAYNGTPTHVIQLGTGPTFEFDNELEPGEQYLVRLTLTNRFGKSGWKDLLIEGQSIAVYYDRATGAIRVLYKKDNVLRCANYYQPQVPSLGNSHPAVADYSRNQAPHSLFRYGSQIYGPLSTGRRPVTQTEGRSWSFGPAVNYRLMGMTITPDGSIFNRLFQNHSTDDIYWTQTSEATPKSTSGLEGFERPSLMLNIGTGYLLIAKLGNDVVCASSQNGTAWGGGGVVSPDSRLLGAFKTADHSIVCVMVLPRGGVPTLVQLYQSHEGWEIGTSLGVEGLPATLRTPASISSDGVRTVMVYRDGGGHGMATSDDLGKTWAVVGE